MIKKRTSGLLIAVVCALVLFCEMYLLRNVEIMSGVYTAPYFSGAANNDFTSHEWLFNPEYGSVIKDMSYYELMVYDFPKESARADLIDNTGFNNKGLLYIIQIASLLFPFLGQAGALVLLQLILHFLISWYIVRILRGSSYKLLFLLFYTINPIVVSIVMTPYYYFWQVVPSVVLIYILNSGKLSSLSRIAIFVVSLFIFFVRPTTIFISILNIFISNRDQKKSIQFAAPVFFVAMLFIYTHYEGSEVNSAPWHTATAGLNAYPSGCFQGYLGDNYVYDVFLNLTGDTVSGSLEDKKMYDPVYRNYYYEVLKKNYFNVAKTCPFSIVKNAALNTLQSFSWGYKPDFISLNIGSALIGLVLLIFFLRLGFYTECIGIFLCAASYTVFYPPIHTYMFGSYLLITFCAVRVLQRHFKKTE